MFLGPNMTKMYYQWSFLPPWPPTWRSGSGTVLHPLYEPLQYAAAHELGNIGVDALRARWGREPNFDPERHLFRRDTRGNLEARWVLDVAIWESLAFAYTRWTLVSDATFWPEVHRLLRKTDEWRERDDTTRKFRAFVEANLPPSPSRQSASAAKRGRRY